MTASASTIVMFLATSAVAGFLGVAALELVMWLVARGVSTRANMVVAIGSLMTRSLDNALMVGAFVHATAAIAFSMLYTLLMLAAGFTGLPEAFMIGLGFGVLHGILMSLILVWVVSDTHPVEEFRRASLAVGLSHLAGHVAYGAVVGLAVGLSPL
jgi:hypothetical protein